jgi:acylphosphatase
MPTRQFIVYGLVQGVGFRYHTLQMAKCLQLNGYVRNNSDGSVTCVAVGTGRQLEQLHQWLHTGPDYAAVTRIEVLDAPALNEEFTSFTIR